MDKFFTLKMIKRYILVLLFLLFLFYIFLIFLFSYKNEIIYALLFLFFILLVLPGIITYLFVKIKNRNPKYIIKTLESIIKEVSNKYSPAICSLLYNEKIVAYSDYTSTILDLESKGYIKIRKNNNDYSIMALKDDISKLNNYEKYVYKCIRNEENFDIVKFKTNVIEDAISLNIIEKRKDKTSGTKSTIFIFSLVLIFISIIIILMSLYMYITAVLIVVGIAAIIITKTNLYIEDKYILTKKGKTLKKQIMGFKYYIKEYTILEKRKQEGKEKIENYIAYALSLGETKALQEFVKKNEQYRDLIFKN